MKLIFSLIFLILIFILILKKDHKKIVFLILLSIFTDVFSIDIGPSLQFNNIIGLLAFPMVFKFYFKSNNEIAKKIFRILKPLWLNYLYLIILGIIFGFVIPWQDTGGYRTWAQQAQGRTIITIIRYFSEFCASLYVAWVLSTDKVTFKFIIKSICWIMLISLFVAILEYLVGSPIIRGIIQVKPKDLSTRFLGLNGEPKNFGRYAALAYFLILNYYIKIKKSDYFLFFIFITLFIVVLSMSASTFILFAMFNLYILINSKKVKYLFVFIFLSAITFTLIKDHPVFEETKIKMEMAVAGSEVIKEYGDNKSYILLFASRFDIFDHLAYVFLVNHPIYFFIGTGPNLISIPASEYTGDFPQYGTYAETGGIDSVPNVMFNNILASSGLIGIFFYFLYFKRIYKFSKLDTTGLVSNLVVGMFLFNMVYFSFAFLLLTGLILGLLSNKNFIMNNKMNILSYPSLKS